MTQQRDQGLVAAMERHRGAVHLGAMAVVVVTQTLVEVVGMVIHVRAVPRLVPATR
ncbi:hypothetical protein ACH4VX_34020 [Streptomyces sp. NPDC020731]|uniref:hypothetical protein n=1 Tax=Streptomyces sp. NPDC020731 TaxID=3365085 RepID=UPI0037B972B7